MKILREKPERRPFPWDYVIMLAILGAFAVVGALIYGDLLPRV